MNPRLRWLLTAAGVIVPLALLGWVGLGIAQNRSATAAEVRQYANSVDLAGLSGVARAEALRRLERMVNQMSADERRKGRLDGTWRKWFDEMTEVEKGRFMEATMPSGFRQWLGSFDTLPADRRRQFIDELTARLKETHTLMTDREPGGASSMYGTNGPPALSAELERRARTIGLKTFYTESSAETKAELAPVLEELQRQMQHEKSPL